MQSGNMAVHFGVASPDLTMLVATTGPYRSIDGGEIW